MASLTGRRNWRAPTREGRRRTREGGLPRPWRDGGLPHGSDPIPTLRANLASRIAGRFARTDAKILALITLKRNKRPYYALSVISDLDPPTVGERTYNSQIFEPPLIEENSIDDVLYENIVDPVTKFLYRNFVKVLNFL